MMSTPKNFWTVVQISSVRSLVLPPGTITEQRLRTRHAVDAVEEVEDAGVRLGREVFEGEEVHVLTKGVYLVDNLHDDPSAARRRLAATLCVPVPVYWSWSCSYRGEDWISGGMSWWGGTMAPSMTTTTRQYISVLLAGALFNTPCRLVIYLTAPRDPPQLM